MIGVAFFGGPFVWIMTLITHIGFRQKKDGRAGQTFLRIAPGGSWSSTLGLVALLAVLISTWRVPSFHVTLLAGPPWLAFITVCYFLFCRAANSKFCKRRKNKAGCKHPAIPSLSSA